ncbi:hypothetical protein EUTSA_v10012048mg, partial [Eutrema salsugineum]
MSCSPAVRKPVLRICLMLLSLMLLQITSVANAASNQASEEDVECVDRYKQKAFQHPLLKNHKIQEMPSEIPNVIEMQKKSSWQTLEARVSTVQCPVGKVPIRRHEAIVDDRIYPKTGGNMTFTPKHEYAEAYTNAGHKLYGTKATINVWDPMVEDRENEASISQIWLTSGDFETNDLNTIEVGWQVCPGLYNDSKPRLFVYWTGDGYKTSGGYNLQKPGFIQTSNNIVLGGAISPISSFGGTQYEITILVWK